MWRARVMRWLVLPGIFVAVGPPAGALTLLAVPLLGLLTAPPADAAFGLAMLLPLGIVFSYPLGGVQALLVGLVAAASVRQGARVRTVPVFLAALALCWMPVAVFSALGQERPETASFLVFAAVHLVAAGAGLAVCRLIEGAGRPRA